MILRRVAGYQVVFRRRCEPIVIGYMVMVKLLSYNVVQPDVSSSNLGLMKLPGYDVVQLRRRHPLRGVACLVACLGP